MHSERVHGTAEEPVPSDDTVVPTAGANVRGMAVSLTLLFSDEAHREAWMRRNGIIGVSPARDADYELRCGESQLLYTIGAEGGSGG